MNASMHESRPDAELESLASNGDKDAFAELYARHFDRVYDFSLRLLRDADGAAEVAQETFLKAIAALGLKKKADPFKTWVLTIARNRALNRLRSRRKVTGPSLEETEEGEAIFWEVEADRLNSAEEAPKAKELAGLVWRAAAALDPKGYSLLDLHVRQGLDGREIAQVLGASKNKASLTLSRLRDSVEQSAAALIMARRGRRECADLNNLLPTRPTDSFDADVRMAISRHFEACPICREQRRELLSPSTIFGALAAVPAPLGLKQKALAEALAQWETVAGSEAGRAGALLSRLFQPVRSAMIGLRLTGWFEGWKGAALLLGGLLVAGGMGAGAVVISGVLDGDERQQASALDQADGAPMAKMGSGLYEFGYLDGIGLTSAHAGGYNPIIDWADLEPQEGAYNWTPLDNALAQAQASGRKAIPRVYTNAAGFSQATPDWVFDAGAEWYYSSPFSSDQGMRQPVPTDPVFEAKFQSFLTVLGNRYDGDPRIQFFQTNAGMGEYGEMVWGYPDELKPPEWDAEENLTTVKDWIDRWDAAFPDTDLAIMVNPIGSDIAEKASDYAAEKGLYLQQNDPSLSDEAVSLFTANQDKTKLIMEVEDHCRTSTVAEGFDEMIDSVFGYGFPIDYLILCNESFTDPQTAARLPAVQSRLRAS
jgi:RNA polymerase sigma factor (sigma-70 family)